jgi:hypothetical protein
VKTTSPSSDRRILPLAARFLWVKTNLGLWFPETRAREVAASDVHAQAPCQGPGLAFGVLGTLANWRNVSPREASRWDICSIGLSSRDAGPDQPGMGEISPTASLLRSHVSFHRCMFDEIKCFVVEKLDESTQSELNLA